MAKLEGEADATDRSPDLRKDLLASVVVFLVALPLCMGVAVASGVPVAAGLITGIVGGIVVGSLAGCPLQVSGPAAGLTVIVFECVQRFGLELLGVVVLLAGAFQIMAGSFRLGQWFRAVSPAVIQGMLAGIGVLIFASQLHVMIDDKPKGSGLENILTLPQAAWKSFDAAPLGDPGSRAKQTAALKSAGELHRRQVAIQERTAEGVAFEHGGAKPAGHGHFPTSLFEHAPDERPAETAKLPSRPLTTSERVSLAGIAPSQQELGKELAELIRQVAALKEEVEPARWEKILAAATVAEEAARKAEASMAGTDAAAVVEAQARAVAGLEGLLASLKNHGFAARLGLFTIGLILLWKAAAPKRLKLIPPPLVAVVGATAAAAYFQLPVFYVEAPDRLWNEIHFPTWVLLSEAPWGAILQTALLVGVVASAETLLSASAVDLMHQGPRTKYDRELMAQGVGNMICGFLGALPMTGVIVRSSANVQAGATTRRSTILHGAWLLVFVVGLAFLLRTIPTACLAAMLVYTGYKLVDVASIRALQAHSWGEVAVYVVTVVGIVCTDLLMGVAAGIALAAVKLLYHFSRLEIELTVDPEQRRADLKLSGAATFIRLPILAAELDRAPAGMDLYVDLADLHTIDHACQDLLKNAAKQRAATGGRLIVDWDSLYGGFRKKMAAANHPAATDSGVHGVLVGAGAPEGDSRA